MSYILEAIKKAESERGETRLYETNRLDTSPQVAKQIPWVAIAIFINAAILLIWIGIQIYSNHASEENITVNALDNTNLQNQVVNPAQSIVSTEKDFQETPTEKNDSLDAMSSSKQITNDTAYKKPRFVSEPIKNEIPAVKPINVEKIATIDKKIIPAKVAPLPEREDMTSSISEELMVKEETAGTELPAEVHIDKEIPIVENTNVPHFNELPYPLQQRIPDISISVHIYNVVKNARKVRVNGRLLHQGDAVNDGLIIQEITTYGVIFNYEGELFKMPL
ncbi:MAG: general secretion pathway protein GspB [Gammaproteobacteria bacterium]